MIAPQICRTEAEIREVVKRYLRELVLEKQEVKIGWSGQEPVVRIIIGYQPSTSEGKYADTLLVSRFGDETVSMTTPKEVTYFEVLSTKATVGQPTSLLA